MILKKTFIISICIAYNFGAFAQNLNFELADPQPQINEVYSGSLLSGDLDNDGDVDIVQSGIGIDGMGLSAQVSVFLNDGNGNFTYKEQGFNNFFSTERAVLSDLDNDDDLDLIITGINRTDFYRNDGQANFIYDETAPFQPSDIGEIIIGDVDGDGDNDVIESGSFGGQNSFTNLFINEGSGIFSLSSTNNFIPFFTNQMEFIDLENDGDKDLICFGTNQNEELDLVLYENDGFGNFSVFENNSITPQEADEISVGDIDNDGDTDMLITGQDINGKAKTNLYLNDGNGLFSEMINTDFPNIFASSNALADLDNDNDLDVLLIGSLDGGLPNIFAIVFENLGNKTFVASDSLKGEYIAKNAIADFNGDGTNDIIIQGFVDDTNVYWNKTVTEVENHNKIPFSLFPNPSTGLFQLEFEKGIFDKMEFLNMQGEVFYSKKVANTNIQNVEVNVPAGIYIVRLLGETGISTKKVFIY